MGLREEETRKKVGKRIQRIRKAAGYTQEELADKIHVSRAYLGHIEQGLKSPSLEVLDKLARSLKVKISDLFG
jgi:transcriptional regulator with XRE-family HTH domain